jgi:hypothetical protein
MAKKRRLSGSTYQERYDNRNEGGSGRKGFIDWKKAAKDKEVKFYEPREGTNKVNIIPFEVKSKLHPMVRAGKMEIGDLDFVLDVWIHRRIGPSETDVLCPKKNYGRSCPDCDLSSKYYDEGKKDEGKAHRATRRVLLNVQPIIRGEAEALKVFDVSHYLFLTELVEEANECANGKDVIHFADIESGKVVKFRATETQLGKNKMMEFKSFAFLDREEELDEDLIDQAISFDEGLILLSAEDIEKILYGQDEDEEEDEKEKDNGKSSKKDEDEEEEEPKKKKDKSKDEEDDEEEEKPKKDKKSSKKKECPASHKWAEADSHKECKKCEVWEECLDDQT